MALELKSGSLYYCYLYVDSPKKWFILRWISFAITWTGVLTLLFSRGHYSIDVVIAYWITTRLWWIYHTLANNPTLIVKENKHNYMNRFWWWYIFVYFEGNVGRPLPKGFGWPLPQVVKDRVRAFYEERVRRRQTRLDDDVDDDVPEAVRGGGV